MFPAPTKLEKLLWPTIVAPFVAGVVGLALLHTNAQAATPSKPTYVISDRDGYGVFECLTQKSDCGKIVADSWCESHGHGPAASFGRAEDITASIAPTAAAPAKGSAIITCTE